MRELVRLQETGQAVTSGVVEGQLTRSMRDATTHLRAPRPSAETNRAEAVAFL
jgi:hypothetical protein